MPRGAAIDLVQSLFRTEPAARPVVVIDGADALTHPEILAGLDRLICSRQPGPRLVMAAHSDPENSFVIPLDEARTRFRYHQLFAEILRYLP